MEINLISNLGKNAGLGHFKRLLSVFNYLQKKFTSTINFYALCEEIPIACQNKNLIYLTGDINEIIATEIVKIGIKQVFIFDLLESSLSKSFQDTILFIKNNDGILIAIDGLLDFNEIDYYFMPTFYFKEGFKNINPSKISWGWQNFLINPKYDQIEYEKKRNNILALTGGSDVKNLSSYMPKLMDKGIKGDYIIDWVVGPFSNQPILDKSNSKQWEIHQSPDSLDDLMVSSKFAITVYGVSFFELLYYGVAVVVFSPYGSKDLLELKQIEELDLAVIASDEKDAVKKINQLIKNREYSEILSNNAKNIFSKRGEETLFDVIAHLIKKRWLIYI